MSDLLLTLVTAITIGSLYALIALGYTMVYGILKFINFAHSDIVVLGAWLSFTIAMWLVPTMGYAPNEAPIWAALVVLLLAMTACGGIGFCIERLAYRPLRKSPRLNVLITAIGISLFLQNIGQRQIDFTWPLSGRFERTIQTASIDPSGSAIQLAEPFTLKPGRQYFVRPTGNSGGDGKLIITSPAGDYDAGQSLRLAGSHDTAKNVTLDLRSIVPLRYPFGTQPMGMPRLLPDRALNEWTALSGTAAAGSVRDNLVLDQPFTIENNRSYTAIVTMPDGSRTSRSVFLQPGDYPAATALTMFPVLPAQPTAGASVDLRASPRVPITLVDASIILIAVSLMILLQLLVYRTKLGMAMRAVSFNTTNAALMGIPVDRVISFTFVLGSSLAAAAGFLYALKFVQIQQTAGALWVLLGLKAFVAAVVGGIGNLRGAVLGGFLIALIEQFGARYVSSEMKDVYVFAVLILVLLVKPTGLLGSTVREKV